MKSVVTNYLKFENL